MIYIRFSIAWARNLFFFCPHVILTCTSFENPCSSLGVSNQSFFSIASANDLKIKWKFFFITADSSGQICSCPWVASIQLQNRNLKARDKSKSSFCNSYFPERMSNQPKGVKIFKNCRHLENVFLKYYLISSILYFKEKKIKSKLILNYNCQTFLLNVSTGLQGYLGSRVE